MKKHVGQSMAEVALILVFIAVAVFTAYRTIGVQAVISFNHMSQALSAVSQQQQQANPIVPIITPVPCNNGNGQGHGYGRCK